MGRVGAPRVPPVLCSVFVFKRNLLRVSFHSAERFDCAKGRASHDLGPVAQDRSDNLRGMWDWVGVGVESTNAPLVGDETRDARTLPLSQAERAT